MPTSPAFFQPGVVVDLGYKNVRDEPNLNEAKSFTEELWLKYRHLADVHFLSDAQTHFLQRFWEMYLACTLIERGIELHRAGNAGPEFFFLHNGRRVWVEAIAPGPGTGADKVPDIVYGEAYTVPTDKILLRFTSALRDKHLKRLKDVSRGIVKADEPVLLAINSRGIPHAPYGSEMPYIIKALLPFGSLSISIDPITRSASEPIYQYRHEIQKENSSSVGTTAFLGNAYESFTAVIHSGVDCANRPASLGDDFVLVHNAGTNFELSKHALPWCRQFQYKDNMLNEVPRAALYLPPDRR